jgi:hypothetical protein
LATYLPGKMPGERPSCHPGFGQALRNSNIIAHGIEMNEKLHASRRGRDPKGAACCGTEGLDQPISPSAIDASHLADVCGEVSIVDEFGQRILQCSRHDLSTVTLSRLKYIDETFRDNRVADANIRAH